MSDPGASPPEPETIAKQADPPSSQDPLIGSLFDQRYQILAQYGSGATATAYKAHDNLLDRDVAVKIIHAHLLSNLRAVERFKTEAATTTTLSHPNIAQVHKQGVGTDGRIYIVMDCLEGESLAELIEKNGKLTLDIFFQIFTQIIEALKYAHEQGVIHRDLKPNNIVLVKEPQGYKAFLVDFGIAKCIDQNNEQGSTQTGALLGSSAYMSPEQCTGTNTDFRSDIYSLACVMLESLMGESPFKGQSALDMMYQHLNESLSKLAFLKDIPGPISELLTKCIQKDPLKRFQSMEELKKDFLACAEMKDTLQRKWSTKKSKGSSANKMLIAGTTALVVICTFTYFSYLKNYTSLDADSEILAARKSAEMDPNKESIPRALRDLDGIAGKCSDLNKRILLYERWQRERSAQADLKEKVVAYIRLIDLHKELSKKDEAIADAISVKKLAQENIPLLQDNKLLQGEILSYALDAYLRVNKPLEAIEFTDEILKKNPSILQKSSNKFDIFSREAYCYDLLGQTQKATELLMDAIKIARASGLRPGQNHAREILIVILSKQGKIAECKPITDDCLKAIQESESNRYLPQEYYNIANSYFQGKAYAESIIWLKQAQEVAKKMGNKNVLGEACHLLLESYRANGDFASAIETEKELLTGNLSWVEQMRSYSDLARDVQRTGDKTNYLSYAEKALEIGRNNLSSSPTHKMDAQLQLLTSIVICRDLLNESNQAEKAGQMLDEWIKLAESKLPNSYLLAKLYQSRAWMFAWTNNSKPAIALTDKSIEIAKQENISRRDRYMICDLLCIKADCLGYAEKYAEKQKCAEQGLALLSRLEPSDRLQINLCLRLADALRKQGHIAEADSLGKQATDLLLHGHSPEDDLDQYRQLAQHYLYQNEPTKAEQISKLALEKAEKLGMGSSDSARVFLHCLQDSYYADKKYKEAVAAGKHAYELASKLKITDNISKGILYGLKCAYSSLGQWDESTAVLDELLRISAPAEKGKVYSELLKTYKSIGKTDKYKITLERALAATSGNSLDDRYNRVFIEIELCRSSLPTDEIEANKHFQAALNIAENLPRNEHHRLAADAYNGLAQMMLNQKKYSEACKLFRSSNEIYRSSMAAMNYQRQNLLEWKAACEAGGDKKQEEEVKQEIARLY